MIPENIFTSAGAMFLITILLASFFWHVARRFVDQASKDTIVGAFAISLLVALLLFVAR